MQMRGGTITDGRSVFGGLDEALEPIWEETHGEPGVVVAIIDGPVDLTHESLRDAKIAQLGDVRVAADGVASRHGTHVASVIFGQPGGPVRGVAPACRGLVIPLFPDEGAADEPEISQ